MNTGDRICGGGRERGRECALMVYDVMAEREIYGGSVERESKRCTGGLYNRDMYL